MLEDHRDVVAAQLAELRGVGAVTSRPAIAIVPAVGSISRISVRTRVDLPEPERPMTTNTSPGHTWKRDVAHGRDAARLLAQLGARAARPRASR